MAGELNLIGDPTNPNPKKPKSQNLAQQLQLGLPSSRPSDYKTEHDTYLPNGERDTYVNNVNTSVQNENDRRDLNQSTLEKAATGLTKAAGLAATTFAGTFTSLPYGIGGTVHNLQNKISSGNPVDFEDFKPMIDNPIINTYNEFNEGLEKQLPAFYSQEEIDAPALSFKNIFTPNFLFDKIVKNAGFTLGAIASGKLVGSMLGDAAQLIARGAYGAEKVGEVEALVAKGMQLPQALNKVATTLKATDRVNQFIASGIMAAGEAQFEANDAYKSGLTNLTEDFKTKMGRDPLPFEAAELDRRANAMGVTTLGANMVILGLSDFVQFGNALTKGFKAEAKGLGKTIIQDGIETAKEVTGFERWKPRIGGFAKGVTSEGLEEGSQTFTQKAAYDYFSRKKDVDAKTDIDGLLHATTTGLAELLGTKEGLESIMLGSITGLASHIGMGVATGELREEWNKADDQYQQRVDKLQEYNHDKESLNFLSDYAKQNGLFKKYEGAIRGQSIQDSMNEAVKSGDVFQFQNLRHDRLKNIIQTYTEAGRLPQLMKQLDSIKDMSDTEFTEAFGVDNLEKKTVSQYVDALKKQTTKISQIWDNVGVRFPLATDSQKEYLWSALTDAENRLTREKELDNKITGLLNDGISEPTKLFSFSALLLKNKEDQQATRKEYREAAEKYLKDNSAANFDIEDVDELFKLQDDRANLVEAYQAMKRGEFPDSNLQTNENTKQQSSSQETSGQSAKNSISTTAPKSSTNSSDGSINPNTSNESAPATPISTKSSTDSNTPKATSKSAQDLADDMLYALAKEKINGFGSLTDEEKKLTARYKVSKTAEDKAAKEIAKHIYAQHLGDDSFAKLLNEQQNKRSSKPSPESKPEVSKEKVVDENKKKEFSTKETSLLADLGVYLKNLKDPKNTNSKLQEVSKNYPTYSTRISEVKELANQLGLTTGRLDGLLTEIEDSLYKPQADTKKKEGSSTTSDGTVDKPKNAKVDKLQPLRIVVDEEQKSLRPSTKSLYDSLQSAVSEMPEGLTGTMDARVVYDTKNNHYNVFINTIEEDGVYVGYIQNTDKNRELFSPEYLKMQDTLRQQAKEDGSTEFDLQWNIGLNNNKSDKPQPLSKSVIKEKDIVAIYQIDKGTLPSEARARNLWNGSKSTRDQAIRLQEAGMTDGYVLEVKDPKGTTRLIGMSGMPVDDSGFITLREILDFNNEINGDRSAEQQIKNLEDNFWIAAARPLGDKIDPFSLVWQLSHEGTPYISVSRNAVEGVRQGDKSNEDTISIYIKNPQGINSQEQFLNSLEVFDNDREKFNERFKDTSIKSVKDLFASNPLRQEIDPKDGRPSLDLFNLSVNGQKPWNVAPQIAKVYDSPQPTQKVAESEENGVETSDELEDGDAFDTLDALDPDELVTTSREPIKEETAPTKLKGKGKAKESVNKPKEDANTAFKTRDSQENLPLLKSNLAEIQKRLAKILPASIKVADLSQLLKGLYNDGRSWAAFSENIIYMSENAPIGVEYHEAFHAVFRTLLNRDEQSYLRNILEKEGLIDSTPEGLAEFRNSRKEYQNLGASQLIDLHQEEKLADLFMTYMNTRGQKGFLHKVFDRLKTLFDKLLSIIGLVKGHQDTLNEVFEKIASGRYKNRVAQENGSDVVFKSLPSLSSADTTKLVGMVRQNLLDRYKKGSNPVKLINELIEKISNRGEFSKPFNAQLHSNKWLEDNEHYYDEDTNRVYPDIFAEPELIQEEVIASLAKYGITVQDEDDGLRVSKVDDEGKRQKDIEYDTNTFAQTGFENLDGSIKLFLTTLGTKSTDGLLTPISVIGTFSQLQRNLAGIESYEDMIEVIRKKAGSNEEMKAIYQSLIEKGNDEYFKEAFRNAFTLEYADHLHASINEKAQTFKVYASNRQDTGQIQLERYKRAYEQLLVEKGAESLKKSAKKVIGELDKLESGIESGKNKSVYPLVNALSEVGIDINPATIEGILEENESVEGEPYEFSNDENLNFSQDIRKIALGISVGNPYVVSESDLEDDDSESADAISRVKRIGKIDATYRNDIYLTSFKNSEGETVNSFTKPNFELVRGREIQDAINVDTDFLKDNYFIKKLGKSGLKRLQISIFGGLREESKEKGISTKKIDPKSKLLSEHMLYSQGYIEWARHEAKSTFTVVNVGKQARFTDQNGSLNKSTLETWRGFIKQDVDRIKRTIEELETLPKPKWIEGYHFKGKEEKGYDPVTKQPIAPNLLDPSTFGNGLKMIQFPQLQTRVQELMKEENLSLVEAIDKAVGDQKTQNEFLNQQHQQMLLDYKNKLAIEGIDPKKNFKLLAGEQSASYSGEQKEDRYLGDYVAGTYTLSNAYDQLSSGEQAYYASHVDITKRRAAMLAAGNSVGTGSIKSIMISDSFSLFNSKTGEQKVTGYFDSTPDGFEKVNKSDAQSYMTAKRWQFVMRRLGKLTKETDQIISRILANDKSVTTEEVRDVMENATANPIKNVYFDGKVYVKTSIIPLFPQLTSTWSDSLQDWVAKPEFEGLHHLRTQMESNGIEEAYRESAMKLQRWGKVFANESGNFDLPQESIFDLQNKYWRLQVENPSGKTKITLGTQLLQLIDSEMNDDDLVDYKGETKSIGEVRREYQSLLSQATLDANTRAQNLFRKVGESGRKQTLLFNILKKSAASSGTSDTALEFYEQTGDGKLKYGTNLAHMSEVYEQGILSYFNKNVFSKKVPGMKLTLVSSDGVKVRDKNTNQMRDLAIHKVVNNQGKEEISYAECYLSEELLHKYDLTLEEFEAQDESTKDKVLSMLGFRIPTQSHHSMIPFKVVGFVPAYYGSVIFAPSEVTWLAGSDFDVDSLFVNRKEFYKAKDGSVHIFGESQDPKTQYKEWKKYIEKKDAGFELTVKLLKENGLKNKEAEKQAYKELGYPTSPEEWKNSPKQSIFSINNGVLDTMLSFMRNPHNKESIFTPASMDSMKSMAKEINTLLGESEESTLPYNYAGSLFSHWKNNSTGKANVGPAANASKTSAFLTKLGVKLNTTLQIGDGISEGYATNYEVDTEQLKGDKRLRKADQLSTLVSAMTDNAKERLAAKLNLTVDNLPVFGNMLALGFGMQRTMRFANQPILRRLSQRVINAKSHLISEGTNWEVSQRFLTSMEDILGDAKLIEELKITQFSDEDLLTSIKKENNDLLANIFSSLNLNESKGKYSKLTPEQKKLFALQYQVLNKYVQLEADTNYFRAVNSILNTNKGPEPSYDAHDKLQDKVKLLASDLAPFDVLGVLSEKAKSIESNLSVSKDDILPKGKDLFVHRTNRFTKLRDTLADFGRMSQDKKKSLKRAYIAQLSMTMLDKSLKSFTGKYLKDYMHLLTASKDIKGEGANIVTKYNEIRTKYASELKDNLFLNQLVARDPNSRNPFFRLEYNSNLRTDPEFKEELTSALKDLSTFGTDNSHPVRKFYADLYIYLAVKDSLQYKNNSFISLLPPSRFTKLAESLNDIQKTLRNLDTMNSREKNEEFKQKVGMYPRYFESVFLGKWVKEFANRQGWYQIDLDGAKNKALVHPKDQKSGKYDYKKLVLDKEMGEDVLNHLTKFNRQKSLVDSKGNTRFPRILQTKKAPKDYTDPESDFAYNNDVDLWINTSIVDGKATYVKVDMENFNPKLSPYALPLNYEVVKLERKKRGDQDAFDAIDNGEEVANEDQGEDQLHEEEDSDEFPEFDDEDDNDAFASIDDPEVEDGEEGDSEGFESAKPLDPDDLQQVASKAVQDATNKLDLC